MSHILWVMFCEFPKFRGAETKFGFQGRQILLCDFLNYLSTFRLCLLNLPLSWQILLSSMGSIKMELMYWQTGKYGRVQSYRQVRRIHAYQTIGYILEYGMDKLSTCYRHIHCWLPTRHPIQMAGIETICVQIIGNFTTNIKLGLTIHRLLPAVLHTRIINIPCIHIP